MGFVRLGEAAKSTLDSGFEPHLWTVFGHVVSTSVFADSTGEERRSAALLISPKGLGPAADSLQPNQEF